MESYLSESAEDTFKKGRELGLQLPINSVICFLGDLAAGKTTFIKGLAYGAAQIDPLAVQSPTFTYLNIYEGTKTIYHFDLYRLRNLHEFLSMGFDDYLEAGGICCIEWSERLEGSLPASSLRVEMVHQGGNKRLITITKVV